MSTFKTIFSRYEKKYVITPQQQTALLAMVGDYCMGIEPKDSAALSGMISSGWLTIADWRIAVSNIGGLLGTVFYTLAALPFAAFLKTLLPGCRSKWDRRLLKLYIAGLILGAGILGIYTTTIGWYYFAFHLGNQAQHLVFSIVFIALIVAIVIYLRRLNRHNNRHNETENADNADEQS